MNRFDGWDSELYHHGIKGQKWGIRRYQNPDGTLTEEGRARYGENAWVHTSSRRMQHDLNKLEKKYASAAAERKRASYKKDQKRYDEATNAMKNIESLQWGIIGQAVEKGYSINSKAVNRAAMTGKTKAIQLLAGPIAALAYTAAVKGSNVETVQGQKFTVKKPKMSFNQKMADHYDRKASKAVGQMINYNGTNVPYFSGYTKQLKYDKAIGARDEYLRREAKKKEKQRLSR